MSLVQVARLVLAAAVSAAVRVVAAAVAAVEPAVQVVGRSAVGV